MEMREHGKQLASISAAIEDPSEVVLLVGAGVSVPAPSSCPTWKQATERALAEANLHDLKPGARAYAQEEMERGKYYNVFWLLKEQLTDALFAQILSHVFGIDGKHPNHIHKLIAQSGVKGVITTNFDPFVEVAFASEASTEARKATFNEDMRLREILSNMDRFFVVKLHGDIGVLDSLVVTPQQCEAVASKSLVQDLFRDIVANRQLVVIGYSLRDPDFLSLWEHTLSSLYLSRPAIVCLSRDDLQPDAEALREHNLFPVSFDNSDRSYSFVPKVLKQIVAMQSPRSVGRPVQRTKFTIQGNLNEYVYLYCQLSENREDRFLAFIASLCLAELLESKEASPSLLVESLRKRVRRQLGLTSARVSSDLSRALARLCSQGIVSVSEGVIRLESRVRRSLMRLHSELRDQERTILSAILAEVSDSQLATETAVDRMRDVVDEVLRWLGWEVAEQVLFARLPDADDKDHIAEVVKNYCIAEGLELSLYVPAVDRLIFAMTEEEEDWFFRKLQAHFLTSAYVIHPTSERLLREYASKHTLFLDSSVALPAIAEGHPLNKVYCSVLRRSSRLGVALRISANMLDEVMGHLGKAIRQFENLDDGHHLREKLEAYIEATGSTQGNVFVEAFLGQLRSGAVMSWRQSLDHLCTQQRGRLQPDKNKLTNYLADAVSVRFDDYILPNEMEGEIERLTQEINNMRTKRRQALGMGTSWMLSRHEAGEFLRIQTLRKREPEKQDLIWFLTTDTHLARLQVQEIERYPIPVAYYPHNWGQYLNLLDYEERSSRHFSKLLRRAEYGVFTGDAAIALVKKLCARFREAKAAVAEAKIAELVSHLLQDYHLKQALSEANQREREGLPPDEREQAVLDQALDTFVIKTQEDWAGLQQELEESSAKQEEKAAEIASLRHRLKAKDHHIGVLRGQLKRKGH